MIRKACASDLPALIRLYDACFPGEEAFRAWFFKHVTAPEHILLEEENGELRAATHALPAALEYRGERFGASYIYAAATEPRFRRRGLMRLLLEHTFEEARQSGMDFSVLITENDSVFPFYFELGYVPSFCVSRETVVANKDASLTLRRAQEGDIPAMLGIYRAETAELLRIARDEAFFRLALLQYGESAYVACDPSGAVTAYAFAYQEPERLWVTEAFGAQHTALCAAAAAEAGKREAVVNTAARRAQVPMGCLLPLTARGREAARAADRRAAYMNLMWN